MKVRPSRKPEQDQQQVYWDGQMPPPRKPTPFLLRLLRGLAGSLSGGMLLLGIVAGIGLWRSGEQFVNGIKMALTPAEPVEAVDVRTVVVQQVRGASELTTAVFAMEAVVPTTSSRTIANYEIGKTTLIYVAYGEVRAGVDLSEVGTQDIEVSGETLRVTLPAPRILDSKLDVNRSAAYEYNRGFLGLGPDRAPELQDKAQEAALQKIQLAACQEGILQTARDRAEMVVGQLLAGSGFVVEVTSLPIDNEACATPGVSTVQ